MFKQFAVIALILISACAITTYAQSEIPYGERMQIDIYGAGINDTDKLCQMSLFRYSHALGWSSYGGGNITNNYVRLNDDTLIKRDLPIVLANSTPYGYEFCVYLKSVIGDPRLIFFYNDTDSVHYLKDVGVDLSTQAYQCMSISEDSTDPFETHLLNVTTPQVGFKCYNCQAGLNEIDVGYTTGSSSYNSTNGGITWSNAGKDYLISGKVFYVPTNTGLLVEYREGLNQTVELATSLRGIPFVDNEKYQSQLIINAGKYTQSNFDIKEPFVIGDYGYYRVICGEDTSTGVFKVGTNINVLDSGYNLYQNIYNNMGIIVAGIFLGALFAIMAVAVILILRYVDFKSLVI